MSERPDYSSPGIEGGAPMDAEAAFAHSTTMHRRTFLKIAATAMATAMGTQVLTGCKSTDEVPSTPADFAGASGQGQPEYDKICRETCSPNCVGSCGIKTFVKDDTIIKVEPADFPDKEYNRICLRGISNAMQRVYSPDRVKYPMKRVGGRGSGDWERISWDDAIQLIHDKMQHNIDTYGSQSNSWFSMVGNYDVVPQVYSSMMSATYEGTGWTSFGIMGDLGCNLAWMATMGIQQDGSSWDDLIGSKSIMMFGCNYAETNMQEMHFIYDAQEAGAKLIVIDPRLSRTASKADWWVPLRPGTDAALIMGMMHVIVENKQYDEEYVRTFTNGAFLVDTATRKLVMQGEDYLVWDSSKNAAVPVAALADELKPKYPSVTVTGEVPSECDVPKTAALLGTFTVNVGGADIQASPAFQLLVDSVAEYTPEYASSICEVPADDIVKLAKIYIESAPCHLQISQGTNRYWNGHLPTRAAIQLAAICGNVGKAHANINWAGGTLMRVLFGVAPGCVMPVEGRKSHSQPGTQWADIVANQALKDGTSYPVKLLWTNAYGWGTQMPWGDYVAQKAIPQLDFIIVSEQMLNSGAEMADLVLPICSYYEEPFALITSWSNMYVQARKQAITPMFESKTDFEIGQLLADKFGLKKGSSWDMDYQEFCRKFVIEGNSAPEFNTIDFDKLVEDQVVRANFDDPYVPLTSGRWQTPSGKLELYTESLLEYGEELATFYEPLESNRKEKAATYPLTFMNSRSVYVTHGQHCNLPWIQEVCPEPWLEIAPRDAKARGVETGDVVEVFNDRGSYKVKAVVTQEIKPGCVNQRQGWWPRYFVDNTHYRSILQMELNPAEDAVLETNFAPYDNLVQVKKA